MGWTYSGGKKPTCPWQRPLQRSGSEASSSSMTSPRRKRSWVGWWGVKSKRAWAWWGRCRGEEAELMPNNADSLWSLRVGQLADVETFILLFFKIKTTHSKKTPTDNRCINVLQNFQEVKGFIQSADLCHLQTKFQSVDSLNRPGGPRLFKVAIYL